MPKTRGIRHSRKEAGEAVSKLSADPSDEEFQKAISQAEGRIRRLYAGRHPDTSELLDGRKIVSTLRPGEIVAFQIFGSLRDIIEMHPDVSKLLDTYVAVLDWNSDLICNRSIRAADILTRIQEVAKPLGGFETYDVAAVEYARWIIRRVVNDIQTDVVSTQNPIFAWWGLRMVHVARLSTPRWITNYLSVAATRISKILDEVHAGGSIGKEAERVGKALGFSIEGPGQGGWFKRSAKEKNAIPHTTSLQSSYA
jgi:hypothetical protein